MPRLSLRTRKPIDQLTPADFAKFPIWEFAIDEEGVPGRDETWVRPIEGDVVELEQWSLSVAAEFKAASGQLLDGFVGVTTAERIELEQPVLLANGKYLCVSQADVVSRGSVARGLAMAEVDVFPLEFKLRVLIRGEKMPRAGLIR